MNTEARRTERRLTRSQAAEYLGLRPQTLAAWATKSRGPTYLKLGRAVRYRERDLEAYLTSCEVRPEADS